jgi:hypothetical protein
MFKDTDALIDLARVVPPGGRTRIQCSPPGTEMHAGSRPGTAAHRHDGIRVTRNRSRPRPEESGQQRPGPLVTIQMGGLRAGCRGHLDATGRPARPGMRRYPQPVCSPAKPQDKARIARCGSLRQTLQAIDPAGRTRLPSGGERCCD